MTKSLDAIGAFKSGFSIANDIQQQRRQQEQLQFLKDQEAYKQAQDQRKIQQEEAKKQLRAEAFNNPAVLAQLYSMDPQEGKSILEAKEFYNNKSYQAIEGLKTASDKPKSWKRTRADLAANGIDVSDIPEEYSPEVASQLQQIQSSLLDPKAMGDLRKQMADIELANAHAAFYRQQRETGGGQTPAALQIANEYEKARKAGNLQRMRDLDKFAKTLEKGTETTPEGTIVPVQGAAETKTTMKQAEKLGTDLGEAQAKAKANLGNIEDNSYFLLDQIDAITNHPGKKGAVGIKGGGALFGNLGSDKIVPGTPEADFASRMKQIEGQAFLQAFDTLRGGGQITEAEGAKATAARMRMSTATSEKDFDEAAKEFADIVRTGLERQRRQARGDFGSKIKKDPLEKKEIKTEIKFLGFE